MLSDRPTVGPAVGDRHPGRGRGTEPATLGRYPCGEATLPIEGPKELTHINQLGLQLDDQERPTTVMPGEHVDHASLAPDGEGDFGLGLPSREASEEPGDRLVHGRVPGVDQATQVATVPTDDEVDLRIERRRDQLQRAEG